jgi:hypothetical protein
MVGPIGSFSLAGQVAPGVKVPPACSHWNCDHGLLQRGLPSMSVHSHMPKESESARAAFLLASSRSLASMPI